MCVVEFEVFESHQKSVAGAHVKQQMTLNEFHHPVRHFPPRQIQRCTKLIIYFNVIPRPVYLYLLILLAYFVFPSWLPSTLPVFPSPTLLLTPCLPSCCIFSFICFCYFPFKTLLVLPLLSYWFTTSLKSTLRLWTVRCLSSFFVKIQCAPITVLSSCCFRPATRSPRCLHDTCNRRELWELVLEHCTELEKRNGGNPFDFFHLSQHSPNCSCPSCEGEVEESNSTYRSNNPRPKQLSGNDSGILPGVKKFYPRQGKKPEGRKNSRKKVGKKERTKYLLDQFC